MKPSTSFREKVEKILEGRVIPKSGINLDTGEPIIDEIVKLHEDELEEAKQQVVDLLMNHRIPDGIESSPEYVKKVTNLVIDQLVSEVKKR